MIKIIHVITGLDTGGAELMLFNVLKASNQSLFKNEVISLTDIGPVGKKIQSLDLPVRALGMKRGPLNVIKILRLIRLLQISSPNLIHTWLYHSNLIGGVTAQLAGRYPVIWSLHSGELNQGVKSMTRSIMRIGATLSHYVPRKIISTSEGARLAHIQNGYDSKKIITIQNGINTNIFKPDESARASVRRELGIPDATFLIGLVARYDPQKDHFNFIQAAAKLHSSNPHVHFLLCGTGITEDNSTLMGWIKAANLETVCHLLGNRDDTARIQASLDIASLSSYGETSSLVVSEAMACGVPCVVTDVGDLALIVGNTGSCVPPRDPLALAKAWEEMLSNSASARRLLGVQARQRILDNFDLSLVVRKYEDIWRAHAQ